MHSLTTPGFVSPPPMDGNWFRDGTKVKFLVWDWCTTDVQHNKKPPRWAVELLSIKFIFSKTQIRCDVQIFLRGYR